MAATLAALWEKRKKVQQNPANLVNLTEDTTFSSQATARIVQDSAPEDIDLRCPGDAASVSNDKQSSGPEKKRKRAHLSAGQHEGSEQRSTRSRIEQGKGVEPMAAAAASEQLEQDLSDDRQAKKPDMCPPAEKHADLGAETVGAGCQASGSAGNCMNAKDALHPQTDADQHASGNLAVSAQPTQTNVDDSHIFPSLGEAQSSSGRHLLRECQFMLQQSMQQAQALTPMTGLPSLTHGQLNRQQVQISTCCRQLAFMLTCCLNATHH